MDDNNLAHSFLDRIKQTIFCKGKLHGAFYLKPRSEFQNRCAKNALSRLLIIIQARIVLVFLRSLFLVWSVAIALGCCGPCCVTTPNDGCKRDQHSLSP